MTQIIATMEHSQKVPEETLVIAPQMLTGYCMAGIDYPGVIHWNGHCGAGSADDSIVDGKDVGLSLYKVRTHTHTHTYTYTHTHTHTHTHVHTHTHTYTTYQPEPTRNPNPNIKTSISISDLRRVDRKSSRPRPVS